MKAQIARWRSQLNNWWQRRHRHEWPLPVPLSFAEVLSPRAQELYTCSHIIEHRARELGPSAQAAATLGPVLRQWLFVLAAKLENQEIEEEFSLHADEIRLLKGSPMLNEPAIIARAKTLQSQLETKCATLACMPHRLTFLEGDEQ